MKMATLKILINSAVLLVWAGSFVSCEDKNSTDNETGETFTRDAYVWFSEGCGYLIYIDTGNQGHFHDMIYIPDDLPDIYKIDNLPVNIIYRHTEKIWNCENGGERSVIDIIKIQKR